jgi:mannose-6-phosphate isomerase-like protein (cupin superfamily)
MCFVDTVWIKQMNFQYRGDVEVGHRHTHDHVTLLAQGSLQVIVGDGITEFTAPHMIVIQKDQEHILKALEDNTVAYCVHALRDDETGDIVSADQVPAGSLYFGRGGLEPVVKKPFTP